MAQGTIAHFGRYSVNEADKTIILHIETSTFPNWNGVEQKRPLTLTGDELRWLRLAAESGEIVLKRAKQVARKLVPCCRDVGPLEPAQAPLFCSFPDVPVSSFATALTTTKSGQLQAADYFVVFVDSLSRRQLTDCRA